MSFSTWASTPASGWQKDHSCVSKLDQSQGLPSADAENDFGRAHCAQGCSLNATVCVINCRLVGQTKWYLSAIVERISTRTKLMIIDNHLLSIDLYDLLVNIYKYISERLMPCYWLLLINICKYRFYQKGQCHAIDYVMVTTLLTFFYPKFRNIQSHLRSTNDALKVIAKFGIKCNPSNVIARTSPSFADLGPFYPNFSPKWTWKSSWNHSIYNPKQEPPKIHM